MSLVVVHLPEHACTYLHEETNFPSNVNKVLDMLRRDVKIPESGLSVTANMKAANSRQLDTSSEAGHPLILNLYFKHSSIEANF